MRTLLAESFPPVWRENSTSSQSGMRLLRSGWTEQSHLEVIAKGGIAEIAALNNGLPGAVQVGRIFSGSAVLGSLANLTEVEVDGMVIATPGALPAEDTDNALERGMARPFQAADLPGGETGAAISQVIRSVLESRKESPLLHEPS